jgi:hypothetical protein
MAAGTSRDNTPRVGDMLVAVGPPPRVGGKVELLEAGHGRWQLELLSSCAGKYHWFSRLINNASLFSIINAHIHALLFTAVQRCLEVLRCSGLYTSVVHQLTRKRAKLADEKERSGVCFRRVSLISTPSVLKYKMF